MVKSVNKLGIDGMYVKIIRGMYEKGRGNMIVNGEKVEGLGLKSGRREGWGV